MAHFDENDSPVSGQSKTAQRLNGKDGTRKVLIIRHGATRLNSDVASVDRIRGWKDIPLSADGKNEAEKLAKTIAAHAPDILVSSDLCRAEETASIIAKHNNIKRDKPTRDFRPWDVGEFAGKKAIDAVPVLAEYATDKPDKPVPGGESFNSFQDRLFTGLHKVLEKHDGLVGIVTHHRVERLLKAWAKGGYRPDKSIDAAEFKKKGERTGHCEIIDIPMKRLGAANGKAYR